ncbi:MAG: tyrosine-type recombinase/integrase [Acutalibacteraceae bacterium]|nr:tyrosine-type recombinase/integrase [Acutalibacteraceae bacterium]
MASITKRGDSYRITVSCGYDTNGKKLTKNCTWKPDSKMTPKQIEKELQRQAVLFEERCRTGQVLQSNTRFAEFAEEWLKAKADELRPRTYDRYIAMIPVINTAIGHMKLDRIQPHHLQAFYKNLSEDGIRQDIKYTCCIDLKALLKEKGLTVAFFSNLCGVSQTTLRCVFKGKNVNESTAKAVCKALNLKENITFKVAEDCKTVLSSTTIHKYHGLISSMLNTAVEWQLIYSNPCSRLKPPKIEKTEPKYLDEVQAVELLECLDNEDMQFKTAVTVLIFTGLRRGELLGLEWQDIDFTHNVIHIRRTSLYSAKRGIFEDTTKNDTSHRALSVSADVIELLQRFRGWQSEQRLRLGSQWNNSDRIFTKWNGLPMNPDTLSADFKKFLKKNNLPDIPLHGLRHTNATLQIASGVPLTTVANRLGHANTVTTSKIYTHAIQSADEQAVAMLDSLLTGKKQKTQKTG